MQLFYSPASPFARKVRIVVRELGLIERTEEWVTPPVSVIPELTAANPFEQLPAMVDDDGVAWTDSALIAARLAEDTHLVPVDRDALWAMRRLDVLAAGLSEMLVKMVLERRRPDNEQSAFWLKRWEDGMMRGFAATERQCPDAGTLNLATIMLAVSASYCDFRYPEIDWRGMAPKVAAVQAELEKRQSFIDTYPK